MKTNKKLFVFLILVLGLVFLNGCIEQRTKLHINEEGLSDLEFKVIADKSFAGDDAEIFVWGILNAFPELQNNYNYTREEKMINYSTYVLHTFESKESIDITSNRHIDFKKEGGSYNFELSIPALLESVTEDSRDDLVYVFEVKLPAEIDMANSRNIEGAKATWRIYKEDLVRGTTLRAFTK